MSGSKHSFNDWQESSYLEGENLSYLEHLYEQYLDDPDSLPDEWKHYFSGVTLSEHDSEVSLEDVRSYFKKLAKTARTQPASAQGVEHAQKESRVAQLIQAYRSYGHHHAQLDPLDLLKRAEVPVLTLAYHGLSESDLDTSFHAADVLGQSDMTLREIIALLEKTYCHHVGVEYMHITEQEEVRWLQSEMESTQNKLKLSVDEKKQLLKQLTSAEGLEKYLGTKYVGQKRFSLEGGESLIPLLKTIIQYSVDHLGVEECVIGMAHRGRLNVLVNILGKSPEELFAEFEGRYIEQPGSSGDVKYHKGFSSDVVIDDKTVHLSLAFNPSHLEIVSPVVLGSVRARQRHFDGDGRAAILPVQIHGDAAMAGQGVVMETFNLSQARGFSTGGSIHISVNNQIGFTTSNPLDARSTLYCTDIAKMVQAPIFHVNGDDPEAVVFVSQLAAAYRQRFKKDVVIDLVCYRRHGHNEADEPSITQPLMYAAIKKHLAARLLYGNELVESGVIKNEDIQGLFDEYFNLLKTGKSVVDVVPPKQSKRKLDFDWTPYNDQSLDKTVSTTFPAKRLKELAKALEAVPKGFTLHPQLVKLVAERQEMTEGKIPVNWGYAETLAYATLLDEGYSVRLCGQDSGRGTFAHRHAEWHDYKTAEVYTPLSQFKVDKARFIVIDSILSEEAVLAFEYGYSATDPKCLTLWEGQFGDFANGAQVVMDQFISSGEQKWNRLSGLTMLLPHGYEGMGPEHSSARLERYLQLCAQKNMQVCIPTTPAQIFHLLRRQMLQPARKPLVVMSPKSLLRHKLAVSDVSELAKGSFQKVIGETKKLNAKKVKRVVLCSGKVYYDLLQKREAEKCDSVAIIRVEQQYPFPRNELTDAIKPYHHVRDVIWCQEEPKNQGAWYQIMYHLEACLGKSQKLSYAGRTASASPAAGNAHQHVHEQELLVNEALGFVKESG